MLQIIDGIKARFHNDLVSDPVVHGWVLNLYRGGERYPQRVCDYFQSEYAPTPELGSAIRRHAADEDKHVVLFSRALQSMDQPVVEIELGDIFNEVIRSFTPDTFHIASSDPEELRRKKLANFLAHAHCLEKRIARSFGYHLDACLQKDRSTVTHALQVAKKDEDRHVSYTWEAVYELLPRKEAQDVLDLHRAVEAKANLLFSERQVRIFLNRFGERLPARRRLMYRVCAMLMEGAGTYV
jgi:hypothetical protein